MTSVTWRIFQRPEDMKNSVVEFPVGNLLGLVEHFGRV